MMESLSELRNRIRTLVAEQLGLDVAEVDPEANIRDDLGADSLDVVELVMPEMIQALKTIPPGPEQQEAVTNMLQANMRPRLGIALVAAIATVLGGAVKGWLPGLRPQT